MALKGEIESLTLLSQPPHRRFIDPFDDLKVSSALSTRSDVAHLLRRAGFGPTRNVLDAAVASGFDTTLAGLLDFSGSDPADAFLPPAMEWYPADLLSAGPGQQATLVARREQFIHEQQKSFPDLVAWWLQRMLTSAHPLREKLALHLHNNFATAISKVRLPLLMYDQNQILRTMGNGNFETLTQALAKDPAMMVWLDTSSDKVQHPNENFARELMERFTMGVGNYTQSDVEQGARGFTGWTIDRMTGQYSFNPHQFDSGVKTYLGQTGNFTGEDIVHMATNSEASHRWVASRLWSFFAYPVSTDDPVVVNDLVPLYAQQLNLADLLDAIFRHPGFTSSQAKTGLVKQPVEWMVGAFGALGLSFSASVGKRAVGALRLLAQVPMDPPNVGGWPQNQYWLSTASSLSRWRIAEELVKLGDISLVDETSSSDRPDAVATMLGITDGWSKSSAAALKDVSADPVQITALALVSPEYVSN